MPKDGWYGSGTEVLSLVLALYVELIIKLLAIKKRWFYDLPFDISYSCVINLNYAFRYLLHSYYLLLELT